MRCGFYIPISLYLATVHLDLQEPKKGSFVEAGLSFPEQQTHKGLQYSSRKQTKPKSLRPIKINPSPSFKIHLFLCKRGERREGFFSQPPEEPVDFSTG